MIFLRHLFLLAVLGACALALPAVSSAASAPRAKPTRPASPDNATAYKGAILIDAATGSVLFEDRADAINPPASMAKLMTFAVLNDLLKAGRIALDTPVTVTRADAKVAMLKDSTSVWLKEKETFPVEELIYAMMIQSANDAAYMLARFSAGSPEAFVEMMNNKARELGMQHTTFRTPHGLTTSSKSVTEGDLTTPRDYALLSRYLVLKTDILKYTSVKERDFGGDQRKEAVKMRNHNHLLGHFDGLDGLKTGYTGGASFCLAATAQRNGHRVIAVVMGSPSYQVRDLKVAELLVKGFSMIPAGSPDFKSELPKSDAPASPVAAAPLPAGDKKPAADDSSLAIKVPPLKKK